MAARPQCMLLAALLIGVGLGGNVLACGALAFDERIWLGCHRSFLFFPVFRKLVASIFCAERLLTSSAAQLLEHQPCRRHNRSGVDAPPGNEPWAAELKQNGRSCIGQYVVGDQRCARVSCRLDRGVCAKWWGRWWWCR